MSRKTLFLPLVAFLAIAWLTGCAKTHGPGLARGEQIYGTCVPCHGQDGHGNATLAAPAIAGLPRWYVERQLTNFKGSMRGAHHLDEAGQRVGAADPQPGTLTRPPFSFLSLCLRVSVRAKNSA